MAYTDTTVLDVLRAAPVLDREATRALVARLFPDREIEPAGDELLHHARNPAEDVAYVGCFPGLDLVCSWQLVAERPSDAERRILAGPPRRSVLLHAMHGAVEWCAFGLWVDGRLVRGVSTSPGGVAEDVGERLPFEASARDGDGTGPCDWGEQALQKYFGFRCDAESGVDDVDPEVVPLVGYRIR